jgi:hypothetical protein
LDARFDQKNTRAANYLDGTADRSVGKQRRSLNAR